MSDVAAVTTQPGATVDSESAFQNFYDAGAFDPNGIPPREEGGQDYDANASAGQEGAQNDAAREQGQENDQPAERQEGAETETPTYASLNDLLTAHKIDPNSVMGLHVTAKIDGVETQVPLSDVLKSYQLEGHVNNKSIELSNQRTAFEQERQAARTLFQQQIQQNTAMGNLAMQQLTHEFQKVDWNALRAHNPAEFAALHAEFNQRHNEIQNYLGAVQQAAQQEAQQQQQAMQQAIKGENEKLMNAIPEWRNGETFKNDTNAMKTYARSLGFQDAELSQIFDHRYMRVLHDAARYQALQAAKPEALKQVRQAPKVVAPGSRVEKNPNDARRQAAIERFNRNPNDIDAQAAVFDALG